MDASVIRIIVVGYYNQGNIGDEQYKICFSHIFKKYNLETSHEIQYIHCDLLKSYENQIQNTDIIILGGGNILNNYLLNTVNDVFYGRPNKILAVSVGIPCPHLYINTNKLSLIDYIFLRTSQELTLFAEYFHPKRIIYLPDISYYLTDIFHQDKILKGHEKKPMYIRRSLKIKDDSKSLSHLSADYIQICSILDGVKYCGKKILALSLNYNTHHYLDHIYCYQHMVKELCNCVIHWIRHGYYIVFLPFNTSHIKEHDHEDEYERKNDILFHIDVINEVKASLSNSIAPCLNLSHSIMNIQSNLSTAETFLLYKYFYISIPMQYHACLFSIYNMVPILPIFTTMKMRNLMSDISWEHMYDLNLNGMIIKLNAITLIKLLASLEENVAPNVTTSVKFWPSHGTVGVVKETVENILCNACVKFKSEIAVGTSILINAIIRPYPKVSTVGLKNRFSNVVSNLLKKLNSVALSQTGFSDFRCVKNKAVQRLLVNIASFHLTNSFYSIYNPALEIKMFETPIRCKLSQEFMWVIRDAQCRQIMLVSDEQNGLFNMNFVNQSNSIHIHRSGWQFVYDNIKHLHHNSASLLLDLSVDKTFQWELSCNREVGIVPYRVPWIGFIHHTFENDFSEFNNVRLFECIEFLESLVNCKGLIVLSNYLRTQMDQVLTKQGYNAIPVYTMVHPIDNSSVSLFTWDKFIRNNDKCVLHIGGWLRNTFAFYQLNLSETLPLYTSTHAHLFHPHVNSCGNRIRKCIIKGLYMENSLPKANILQTIYRTMSRNNNECVLVEDPADLTLSCSGGGTVQNNWEKYFLKHLTNVFREIETIDRLDNDAYDNILTQNIVFLNLVDASAINTVLECLIRNTPILVNRHPAVVELLGKGYPLYYNSFDLNDAKCYNTMNEQINCLLSDGTILYRTTQYLRKMKKDRFDIKYFIEHLKNIVKSVV